MRVAGLTGGIATGKSYCLARFAALGARVIDADRLARDVVAPGTPGLAAVSARFGASILRSDGTLDRAALGRIVFSDRTAREDLEAIVHPEVYRRIREWAQALPADTPLAVADVPLLFETGRAREFEVVIVCACEPEEQVRRIQARDGLSEAEARERLAAQWPIADKIAPADYVIRTDGTHEETARQVEAVWRTLVSGSDRGQTGV
jgi:dephospho-CoA kinase